MPLQNPCPPGTPQRGPFLRRKRLQRQHSLRQRRVIPRRHQPAGHALLHQLRYPRDVGGNHRPPGRHRLHDHHRQPLGEARQHQRMTPGQRVPDFVLGLPPGQRHVIPKPPLRNLLLQRPAQLPVANQRQPRVRHRIDHPAHHRHQDQLPLLLRQPPDIHQPQALVRHRPRLRKHLRVDPAMHHLHAVPRLMRQPPAQLAPPVGTHRHRKRRPLHLPRQRQRMHRVELLRPVHRETVRRPAQNTHKHRHRGRIRAEMRVHMLHAPGLHQPQHMARLQEVNQMPDPPQRRHRRQPHRLLPRREKRPRPPHQRPQQRQQQRHLPCLQHIARPPQLLAVLRVLQRQVAPPHRDPVDRQAQPLQPLQLAPDEALRRLGIGIENISDFHVGHRAESTRPPRYKRRNVKESATAKA